MMVVSMCCKHMHCTDVARGQSLSCSRGGLSAQAAAANASSSSGGSGCALGSWPVPLMLHSMTDESAALSTSNKSERRVVIGRAHPMLATKSTSDADCKWCTRWMMLVGLRR